MVHLVEVKFTFDSKGFPVIFQDMESVYLEQSSEIAQRGAKVKEWHGWKHLSSAFFVPCEYDVKKFGLKTVVYRLTT